MKKKAKLRKPNLPQRDLFGTNNIPSKQKQSTDNDWTFDILDALASPILTFSMAWADTIPKRILDIVPIARMVSLMKKDATATYPECAVYMYTRTFEAPMDYEWSHIYTYVVSQTVQTWFGENPRKDLDIDIPTELNQWLRSKLEDLRRHIYRKRREILKTRLKQEERIEPKPQKVETPKKNIIAEQKTFLF